MPNIATMRRNGNWHSGKTQARSAGVHGFTLLEVLVAMTIMAILAGLAVPAWDTLVQSLRVRTVVSSLERALRLTRQEAILQQLTARMCPSVDLEVCEGQDWSTGWLAFVDATGTAFRDAEDPLIAAHGPVPGLAVHYNRGGMISADPQGRLTQNGTMRICGSDHRRENYSIVLTRTGRLRLTTSRESC